MSPLAKSPVLRSIEMMVPPLMRVLVIAGVL
jgi:hypothetical protein